MSELQTFTVVKDGKTYQTEAFSQEGANEKIDLFLAQQEVEDRITDEQAKSGIGDAILS